MDTINQAFSGLSGLFEGLLGTLAGIPQSFFSLLGSLGLG